MATNIIADLPYVITDLPEEIQEYMLSMMSPYRDLKSCLIVCKLWNRLGKGVIAQHYESLHKAVSADDLSWQGLAPEAGPTITERHSHSACYYDKSMYVFGGCTSTSTTFNDLWRFDLATRQWIRPLAMGTYPSPKACASMVVYQNNLVLFGGWSHPTPYPLHQAARFFSELHIYTTSTNRWHHLPTRGNPPPTAGHSASFAGDRMIVYGGSHGNGTSTSDLWSINLREQHWTKHEIPGLKKPRSRYGQTQVALNDTNILILGGCGGPNMQYSDVWLLCMDTTPWQWRELQVNNSQHMPAKIWCHPACKVGNKIVLLSKLRKLATSPGSSHSGLSSIGKLSKLWIPPEGSPTHSANTSSPDRPQTSPASASQLPNVHNKRCKGRPIKNPMHLFVLDISEALTKDHVTWQPSLGDETGPEETNFYSIVEGRGELIMFGGVHTDINKMQHGGYPTQDPQVVTNNVYFIQPNKYRL